MIEKLLSCFKITESDDETVPLRHRRKGTLVICPQHANPGISRPLKKYSNRKKYRYEENHLEEWISREPSALFPNQVMMIIASQNYIFLQARIDLLFLNQNGEFQIAELKSEPIAQNTQTTPYKVWEQIRGYKQFLLRINPYDHFPEHYGRFTERFYGHPYDFSQQVEKYCGKKLSIFPKICEIYVAESFDNYSVNILFEKGQQEKNNVRCIFYKFFPQDHAQDDYIEFWEVFPN